MVPEIELNQSCVRLEKDSSSNGENHWNKLVARKGNNIQIIQISFCLKIPNWKMVPELLRVAPSTFRS